MKLEFTNDFIKTIENRCRKFLFKDGWFEIQGVDYDAMEGGFWTIRLGWGKGDKCHNEEIFFEDKYYSVDFICGMIYQLMGAIEDDN